MYDHEYYKRAHAPDQNVRSESASHIFDRREMLRVKVNSLAAEARLIRKARKETFGRLAWELNDHRTGVLRRHARHACLALGFLKGRALHEMEEKTRASRSTPPNLVEVARLLKRYGPKGYGFVNDGNSQRWAKVDKGVPHARQV